MTQNNLNKRFSFKILQPEILSLMVGVFCGSLVYAQQTTAPRTEFERFVQSCGEHNLAFFENNVRYGQRELAASEENLSLLDRSFRSSQASGGTHISVSSPTLGSGVFGPLAILRERDDQIRRVAAMQRTLSDHRACLTQARRPNIRSLLLQRLRQSLSAQGQPVPALDVVACSQSSQLSDTDLESHYIAATNPEYRPQWGELQSQVVLGAPERPAYIPLPALHLQSHLFLVRGTNEVFFRHGQQISSRFAMQGAGESYCSLQFPPTAPEASVIDYAPVSFTTIQCRVVGEQYQACPNPPEYRDRGFCTSIPYWHAQLQCDVSGSDGTHSTIGGYCRRNGNVHRTLSNGDPSFPLFSAGSTQMRIRDMRDAFVGPESEHHQNFTMDQTVCRSVQPLDRQEEPASSAVGAVD